MTERGWKCVCLVLVAAVLIEAVMLMRRAPRGAPEPPAADRPAPRTASSPAQAPARVPLAPAVTPVAPAEVEYAWPNQPAPSLQESFEAFAKLNDLPCYRIPLVKTAPVIDGEQDEAYAAAAPAEFIFLDGRKDRPTGKTVVHAVSTDKELFLFYQCFSPDMTALRTNVTEHDWRVWEDDSVEFFLDPTNTRKMGSFFFISINANGITAEARSHRPYNDFSWEPGLRVKTRKTAEFWALELALPFADVPEGRNHRVWAGNFNRMAFLPKATEDTAWCPTFDQSSHIPPRFGFFWLDACAVNPAAVGEAALAVGVGAGRGTGAKMDRGAPAESDYAWWTGPRHVFRPAAEPLFKIAPDVRDRMLKCKHPTPNEDQAYWFGELAADDGPGILVVTDGDAVRITTAWPRPVHARWVTPKVLYLWSPAGEHEAACALYDVEQGKLLVEELGDDGVRTWERLIGARPAPGAE